MRITVRISFCVDIEKEVSIAMLGEELLQKLFENPTEITLWCVHITREAPHCETIRDRPSRILNFCIVGKTELCESSRKLE